MNEGPKIPHFFFLSRGRSGLAIRRPRLFLKRWSDDPIYYEDELTYAFLGRWTWLYSVPLARWHFVSGRPPLATDMRRRSCSVALVSWQEYRRACGWRAWLAVLEDFLGWRFLSFRLDRRWREPPGYNPYREEPMRQVGGEIEIAREEERCHRDH